MTSLSWIVCACGLCARVDCVCVRISCNYSDVKMNAMASQITGFR